MSDDLLTTVKAELAIVPELDIDDWSMAYTDGLRTSRITGRMLRALLARCEEAEGCDGNCSCVVMSRHEWQRAYSEERLKREAAEAERDAARAEAARLKKELAAKIPGQVVQSIRDDRDRLCAEAARLREARADDVALVARLSHQVVALRDAITRVLDGPHYIDRDYQDVLLAALDTPAREGWEG